MSSTAAPSQPVFRFGEFPWSPSAEVRAISEGLRNLPRSLSKARSFVIVQDSPLAVARKRINEFKSLPENWDSYGARRVSPEAISIVRELFRSLENNGTLASQEFAPFTVAPLSDGGLQAEWRRGGRALEIEAHPNGDFGYLRDDPGASVRFTERDSLSIDEALNVIQSFLNLAV